jgi:putative PIN family toxin of toxin-antitoxin system
MKQKVVLDTNVLVSALWSKEGKPAQILAMILSDQIIPCYDYRIMQEYHEVLNRPKFHFSKANVKDILYRIKADGFSVTAPLLNVKFIDESDKKFLEVAKFCQAFLITGNVRHYPQDDCIITIADFLAGKVVLS